MPRRAPLRLRRLRQLLHVEADGHAVATRIKAWVATPNPPGGKVYDLKQAKPASLEDGDIVVLIAGHEHIGITAEDGTIYQAEETKAGVTARGKFKLDAPGSWTHLVRLPN